MFEVITGAMLLAFVAAAFVWPRVRRHLVESLDTSWKKALPDSIREFLRDWVIPNAFGAITAFFFLVIGYFGFSREILKFESLRTFWDRVQPNTLLILVGGLEIAVFAAVSGWLLWEHKALGLTRKIRALGFKESWEKFPEQPTASPWSALIADIGREDNNFVHILGANGRDTFGGSRSALSKPLADFKGDIRVMLIDPECREMEIRAVEVIPENRLIKQNLDPAVKDYRDAINNSIERLKELQGQRGSSINEVKWCFYSEQPRWKLIITSKAAWVQYYLPRKHVADTPIYQFENTPNPEGIYHLFASEFDHMWQIYSDQDVANARKKKKRNNLSTRRTGRRGLRHKRTDQ